MSTVGVGITCYVWAMCCGYTVVLHRILQPIYTKNEARNQISSSAPFNRMLWRLLLRMGVSLCHYKA